MRSNDDDDEEKDSKLEDTNLKFRVQFKSWKTHSQNRKFPKQLNGLG